MSTTTKLSPKELQKEWKKLLEQEPKLRIRDAAKKLAVSESELLATKIGAGVSRLEGNWGDFAKRLPELKQVMALTRNEGCVLEHKGTFQKVSVFGGGAHQMATVIGPIEQRLFLHAWKAAFSVESESQNGLLRSIQIFDKAGDAILKIYLKEKGDEEAWNQLIADFTAENQEKEQTTETVSPTPTVKKEAIDAEKLRKEWSELQDTHDFFGLLRKHKANRVDALELVEGQFSQRANAEALKSLLEQAAKEEFPIMIFAGNRGNIQIHQGKVKTIKEMGTWLNVLDPDFNMHLRTDLIDTAWVVRKPTKDGDVTSIELYDKNKEQIAQFFGLRKPGIPEREDWRTLIQEHML